MDARFLALSGPSVPAPERAALLPASRSLLRRSALRTSWPSTADAGSGPVEGVTTQQREDCQNTEPERQHITTSRETFFSMQSETKGSRQSTTIKSRPQVHTRVGDLRAVFWRQGLWSSRGACVRQSLGAAALDHLVQHKANHAVPQGHHCAQEVQQAQPLRCILILAAQQQQQPFNLHTCTMHVTLMHHRQCFL